MTTFEFLAPLPPDDQIPPHVHAQHRRVTARKAAEMATADESERAWIEHTRRLGWVHPFQVFIPVDRGVTAEPVEDTRGRSHVVERLE